MGLPMQVPFSMFVQSVRGNDVLAVVIEGRRMGYKLRPRSLARMLPKVCTTPAWETSCQGPRMGWMNAGGIINATVLHHLGANTPAELAGCLLW